MFCAIMFVPVFVGLIVVGLFWEDPDNAGGEHPAPSVASASPATVTPVEWTYQGTVCADGRVSASVGKRGACSHHGGVAGRWTTADGTEAICRGDPPRTQEDISRQMAKFGRIAC
jgi:hypothetical protein